MFFRLIAIIVFFISCQRDMMEDVLNKSASNRKELERLLNYYSQYPEDSLKLKAAEFLILNMPGHYAFDHPGFCEYFSSTDKMKVTPEFRKLFETIPYRCNAGWGDFLIKEDILCISSNYLIQHIERCFNWWKTLPWLENLSFRDFCEYILPYRLDHELIREQADSAYGYLNLQEQSWMLYDDIKYSIPFIAQRLGNYSNLVGYEIAGRQVVLPTIGKYIYGCMDNCIKEWWKYHYNGLPVAIDYVPCWGNYDGSHYWIAFIDRINNNHPNIRATKRNVAKVFRKTYSRQKVLEIKNNEYIPELFLDPFHIDVTDEYVNTADIDIAFQKIGKSEYNYLSVFNDLKWTPIAWSKDEYFEKMGRNVVYVPTYYYQQKIRFANYPFILDANGEKHFLIPDITQMQTLYLVRKYPFESYKEYYGMSLVGGNIVLAQDSLFHFTDTVFQISQNPNMRYYKIKISKKRKYRYCRFIVQRYSMIAEVHFNDSTGKEVEGKWTGSHVENINFITDNNILTCAGIYDQLQVDFQDSVCLSEISFLPRNDGNGIYSGDLYELLYMTKEGWVSCGRKKANGENINFENIPSHALYWLRNRTTGKEERVFTYQKNGIHFW